LIQSGTLSKGEFYTLYKGDTKSVYGEIIKSYNRIYFIDNDLDISIYKKEWDVLLIPPH